METTQGGYPADSQPCSSARPLSCHQAGGRGKREKSVEAGAMQERKNAITHNLFIRTASKQKQARRLSSQILSLALRCVAYASKCVTSFKYTQ
jgi:hypothetical protein